MALVEGSWLIEWLQALGGLRTFWTRRARSVEVESSDPLKLRVSWRPGRVCSEAIFMASSDPESIEEFIGEARGGGARATRATCYILVTTLQIDPRLYDRRSVAYIYTGESRLLEPNRDVEVEIYEDPGEEALRDAEAVQRRSWGFYAPPRRGSVVLIARLHGEPVGSAYYHPASGNIDYGIHVAREYWRRRIGTRLLHEALRYAGARGAERVTVVRVLRGRGRPSGSDRRALAFYEANDPKVRLHVYRIARI